MADTLTGITPEATDAVPEFPMPRDARCPFDPPPGLKKLQEQAPLTKVRIEGGGEAWLVTRYAEQRELLGHPGISADTDSPGYPSKDRAEDGGGGKLSFIMMDDPEHARLRRMVTAPFAIKKVEALRPTVQRIVDDLIDDLLAGPRPVDLVEAFALPLPSLVICELLGVPYDDHDFFQANTKTVIHRESTPKQRGDATRAIAGYLGGLIGKRIAEPKDDLLSSIAGRVTAGEIDHRQATEMALLLLIAGHETTANMIALGTLALLRNPDQLALLRDTDDPKLVSSAVEELLRYLHITHLGRRRAATEDIEIAGQVIKAGEGVVMVNEIANRDPEVFPDPDRLDLTRDARRHVAFGFGIHQCLGQPLARMELQVVYGTLYKRVPGLKLACSPEDVRFKEDAFVYGVHELPVTW
ncbi:cytochrome P450 [Streptomyces ipomoeae]|uniref:Unspecific monooxygenase n=1 Tax=Streptomyces ipomoeae 91-03 TaxID=698759 RepID=L1L537_9ACTN|nr:cytochrome P450 [Streptomyces ipomoeae]EKX68181.1 unspecific monooxygenase [Streptomyces ipomoeae 91-03]MDX2695623.1 cytochrome P450 [Streptomyces ipomoeae]MDX2838847.1 cytochrome P450 [Streptomyces ipomoeae]MDX2931755.1 cytochrome P450 [Streptomyces ipomoeae]TQE27583.1 cytochrome P450 [Streptomyces ipomoeae]